VSNAIVVMNAGSSSVKFSIHRVRDQQHQQLDVAARGQIDGIGSAPKLKVKDASGELLVHENLSSAAKPFTHSEAFKHVTDWALNHFRDELHVIGVGHRIVHGGLEFAEPTIIDASVLAKLEQFVPLDPLHQPINLAGVRAVMELRADLPQVACFDTAFHRGRATVTERTGLPDEYFQRGVRRWGFHGLSYEYIAGRLRQLAPRVASGRVIVAHLGNGASMCAMHDGRSVDTTMGFSVLDGLPMGTRCGSLDPGALLYLLNEMPADNLQDMLYQRSGLLGISGISSDMRALLESTEPRAAEAIEYFVYRAVREIGSLVAALGGLDALVFTAGIGENAAVIRRRICEEFAWLRIDISLEANERNDLRISRELTPPSVWVIPTNEEAVIAAHTVRAISSTPSSGEQ
jgi:acetate kinase